MSLVSEMIQDRNKFTIYQLFLMAPNHLQISYDTLR